MCIAVFKLLHRSILMQQVSKQLQTKVIQYTGLGQCNIELIQAASYILAIRDLVSSVANPRCFRTNYQESVYDFWTAPNGVRWNFQVATFGFDWPQSGILFMPLGGLLYIDRITFVGSDNLNSFRVAFTKNSGKVILTDVSDRRWTLNVKG